MQKNIFNIFSVVVASVFLGFSAFVFLGKTSAQWSGPAGDPPTLNSEAPLNIGSSNQRKEGGLTLGRDLYLEGGMRLFSIGGSRHWTFVNEADTLKLETDQGSGEITLFSITNSGDVTAQGKIFSEGNEVLTTASSGIGSSGPETDPTVPTDIKDGIDWSEISGIPAGFSDGVDDVASGSGSATLGPDSVGSSEIIDGSLTSADIDTDSMQVRVSGTCPDGFYADAVNMDGTLSCKSIAASSSGIKGTYLIRVHSGSGGIFGNFGCGANAVVSGVGCYDSIGTSNNTQCACTSFNPDGSCRGYFTDDAFLYCLQF